MPWPQSIMPQYWTEMVPWWWKIWLRDESECTWVVQDSEGEFCGERGGTLHTLNLSNKIMLTGTIPDEIGLLRSLKVINLKKNSISETVPSELGSLTALTSLSLYGNKFTGTVASELGTLTALTSLILDSNSFNGTVPSELGSLTALTSLHLGSNSFTGTVPSELGSLTDLSFLILGTNSFTGTVPSEFGSLNALTTLLLGWTSQFTGCWSLWKTNKGQAMNGQWSKERPLGREVRIHLSRQSMAVRLSRQEVRVYLSRQLTVVKGRSIVQEQCVNTEYRDHD